MPNVENIASTRFVNIRRSQRVVLSLPLVVRAIVKDREPIVETAHTLMVNAHGALIALKMSVELKQALILEHSATRKLQKAHVVYRGKRTLDTSEIGVEFDEPPPYFWNIAFPRPDWKPLPD